ncbi:hypothetical protein F2P56_017417 [Juglans regia]|uniref:RNase H type-1 domain-containing protein n=2 Tax=Juglans regia TaxID=51240 RepID=A0A833X6L3_JUGRE|nr:uncharacterized protein LOC109000944 [Juglans regia]KAF5461306.1 hypothetical protein F2P56_017417 [Juglans regia]
MGIGIVIRDEMGEALTACCDQKEHVQHPATAECMALWKAMEISRDLGFHRVVFEGDAQNIVRAINEDNTDYPSYGSIIHDAKKMLQQQQGWKVQYAHRTSNEVAHKLAKQALCLESEFIWMDVMPTFISDRIDMEKQCIDNITQS